MATKRQKPIDEQVIVLTGATSGIGLVTAREAARQGARLVLAARGEEALQKLVEEIELGGGEAAYVAADVGKEEDVRMISRKAIEHFGRFDTWVNNAGVSIYGPVMDVSIEDHRKLFETNYWGCVYGCREAVDHLRERGGTIINIGSVLGDRSIPQQGPYSASKHALKGITEALRMEVEEEGLPINITLINPSGIATPYNDHAKNYFDVRPINPPFIYAPDVVAEAILYCAVHPRRQVTVGAGGRILATMGQVFPGFTDVLMRRRITQLQKSDEPPRSNGVNGLYASRGNLEERTDYPYPVAESSLWTKAMLHPRLTAAALVAAAVGVAGLTSIGRNGRS